jgi:hypothetical protein
MAVPTLPGGLTDHQLTTALVNPQIGVGHLRGGADDHRVAVAHCAGLRCWYGDNTTLNASWPENGGG